MYEEYRVLQELSLAALLCGRQQGVPSCIEVSLPPSLAEAAAAQHPHPPAGLHEEAMATASGSASEDAASSMEEGSFGGEGRDHLDASSDDFQASRGKNRGCSLLVVGTRLLGCGRGGR